MNNGKARAATSDSSRIGPDWGSPEHQVGTVSIEYTQHEPVFGGGDMTPGQMIDRMLEQARMDGRHVRRVSFEIEG